MIIWAGIVLKCLAALAFLYKRILARGAPPERSASFADLANKSQAVTVQIPLYNEPMHAKGVIEAAGKLQWPDELLELQILDDSTDKTVGIVSAAIKNLSLNRPGLRVAHLIREDRVGYKAGALNEGLKKAKGQFFAIFDADFRPYPTFLEEVMPHFSQESQCSKIAFVQAPWGYRNDQDNLLTRIQSRLLGVHFFFEHRGRFNRGFVFNFNGTAGVWEKEAIIASGGWNDRSVTEDLYLSFKSKLLGFEQVYASVKPVPSDLPSTLTAFLVQQRRWAKGNGQVLRLLFKEVLASPKLSKGQCFDMLWHMLGYGFAVFLLFAFFLSPFFVEDVAMWVKQSEWWEYTRLLSLTSLTLFFGSAFYLFANRELGQHLRRPNRFVAVFETISIVLFAPMMIALIGPSYFSGLLSLGSKKAQLYFARTPKGLSSAKTKGEIVTIAFILGFYIWLGVDCFKKELWPMAILCLVGFLNNLWISTGLLRSSRARGLLSKIGVPVKVAN